MTAAKSPKQTRPPKRRVPQFTTLQEEAQFWDTHDLADFAGEWEPVTLSPTPDFSHALLVDLPPEALDALAERAQQQGLVPASLARSWILERLRAS